MIAPSWSGNRLLITGSCQIKNRPYHRKMVCAHWPCSEEPRIPFRPVPSMSDPVRSYMSTGRPSNDDTVMSKEVTCVKPNVYSQLWIRTWLNSEMPASTYLSEYEFSVSSPDRRHTRLVSEEGWYKRGHGLVSSPPTGDSLLYQPIHVDLLTLSVSPSAWTVPPTTRPGRLRQCGSPHAPRDAAPQPASPSLDPFLVDDCTHSYLQAF